MEVAGKGGSRVCSGQVEGVHDLERGETGQTTVQEFNTREPSKGELSRSLSLSKLYVLHSICTKALIYWVQNAGGCTL